MTHLDALEAQTIHILREAFACIDRLAMLWSFGKDSQALLFMVRRAFFGHVPFPVIHIDTSYEPPEMLEFRDRIAAEWKLDLVVGRNEAALAQGMSHTRGRILCCSALKTAALRQTIAAHGFTGVIAGIRRDEEGTRAKERVFSPRDAEGRYDSRHQPPEFWDHYATEFPKGAHVRIHPLLHWTEIDVWRYLARESIPVVSLYFSQGGRRYRSLGCAPCTGTVASEASSIAEIITELEQTRIPERAGRLQDREAEDAFERLRAGGHM
jgi:sulfate adenylyltransferase subunit 2